MMSAKQFSSATHGVEIDIQYAERRDACIRALADLYHEHRYRPYHLPLIDNYDSYSDLLSAADIQRSFRFVNSAGELVLLRPDFTLFLARHIANTLQRDDLPLRLCYNDSVIRERSRSEGGGQLEQYQSGVELIGNLNGAALHSSADNFNYAEIEAELELFTLLQQALEKLSLQESVIHIGSRAIVYHALDYLNVERDRHEAFVTAIRHRRAEEISQFLERGNERMAIIAEQARAFLLYIGENIPPIPQGIFQEDASAFRSELHRLKTLVSIARKRGVRNIRIDISEIGDRNYYNGTTFAVYHPRIADKIASGGRYDNLFATQGFSAPAVGFTLFLHRCEEYAEVAMQRGEPVGR